MWPPLTLHLHFPRRYMEVWLFSWWQLLHCTCVEDLLGASPAVQVVKLENICSKKIFIIKIKLTVYDQLDLEM